MCHNALARLSVSKMTQSQQGIRFITNRNLLDNHEQKLHLTTDILSMSGDQHLQKPHIK